VDRFPPYLEVDVRIRRQREAQLAAASELALGQNAAKLVTQVEMTSTTLAPPDLRSPTQSGLQSTSSTPRSGSSNST
jgi:hypothetical protein